MEADNRQEVQHGRRGAAPGEWEVVGGGAETRESVRDARTDQGRLIKSRYRVKSRVLF